MFGVLLDGTGMDLHITCVYILPAGSQHTFHQTSSLCSTLFTERHSVTAGILEGSHSKFGAPPHLGWLSLPENLGMPSQMDTFEAIIIQALSCTVTMGKCAGSCSHKHGAVQTLVCCDG